MLSSPTKKMIADEVQKILKKVKDSELPKGEISFILHIDGASSVSWANIRNNSAKSEPVPDVLIQNLTV